MSHPPSCRFPVALFAAAALLAPLPAEAQYFGQNKVQYRDSNQGPETRTSTSTTTRRRKRR